MSPKVGNALSYDLPQLFFMHVLVSATKLLDMKLAVKE